MILRYLVLISAFVLILICVPAGRSATSHDSVRQLRRGVVWQRTTTEKWRAYALLPSIPSRHAETRTRSRQYLVWMGSLWNRRRRYAKKIAHNRNKGTVQQVICRVFRGPELCSTALYIAYRESRYDIWAWNSSDHGGLFQLGAPERSEYASIGYSTAWEQTVAAHNLWLARGWEPWSL